MSVSQSEERRPVVVAGVPGVSMRELLASCACADAVSRPPRAPVSAAPLRGAGNCATSHDGAAADGSQQLRRSA
ncbi:hypothetical protein [Streptomyces sp. NPDC047061]|uniref:hypothetical protein n=1 Tax=Streptomyces sp. NPDC047061 TaxID=3154605 RepID=UPI003403C30E